MRLSAGFKTFLVVLGIFVVLMVAGALFPQPSGSERTKRAHARFDANHLAVGLMAYREEYGQFLKGELPHIITTLTGDNPRKIVFIEVEPKSLNAKGEFVDPWGTPYKILPQPNERLPRLVGVYSCGKNREDEHGAESSDDLVSWR
jgi:hypothetical protein